MEDCRLQNQYSYLPLTTLPSQINVVTCIMFLQLRYLLDPSYMQSGEGRVFSQYLLGQALHIDAWDGDSLLLIGSTSLQLKVQGFKP